MTTKIKIVILHWFGTCPHCNKKTRIYADFQRDEDGIKWQNGFECDLCHAWISDEDFDKISDIEMTQSSRGETP